jgi:hypothetical protein
MGLLRRHNSVTITGLSTTTFDLCIPKDQLWQPARKVGASHSASMSTVLTPATYACCVGLGANRRKVPN